MRHLILLIAIASLSVRCAAGEPARAEFQSAWDDWNTWCKTVEVGFEPPPDLSGRLNKTFNAWIRADQDELLAKARQCETLHERDLSLPILAEEIAQTCKTRIENDVIVRFPDVVSWYALLQGYVLAFVDYDRASAAWINALRLGEGSQGPAEKEQAMAVLRFVARSMMQFYSRHGKYENIVGMISPGHVAPHMLFLYQGDTGKELLVNFAAATTKLAKEQHEFERAVRELTQYLEIEQREAPRSPWSDEFSRSFADVFSAAHRQSVSWRLTMQQYLWVAHGSLLSAHEKLAQSEEKQQRDPQVSRALHAEALAALEFAGQCCQRTLLLARSPKTDLAARLKYEPAACMMLGTAYIKSQNYHEAIVVFRDLLRRFSPRGREEYLPRLRDPKHSASPKIAALLKHLDDPKNEGGLLAQAEGNLFFAIKKNGELHSDAWNKEMLARAFGGPIEKPAAPGFTDVTPLPRPPRSPGGVERLKALADSTVQAHRWIEGVAGKGSSRTSAGRALLVRKYGGSAETEAAVARALRWLAQHQEADGHWDAMKYQAGQKTDTAVTAFALMAFVANGNSERAGEYRDNVSRAVAWLKSKQNEKGMIWDNTDAGAHRGEGYPCAIATQAMAEAAAASGVADTVRAAQRAVEYCTEIHQAGVPNEMLAWRYSAKSVGDVSVTGCFLMALKSAKSAGLKVPHGSLEGAMQFLDSVEHKISGNNAPGSASSYWYMKDREFGHGGNHHRLTAIGVTSRFMFGWPAKDLNSSVEAFIDKGGLPAWGANGESVDFYYWYYGTLASFQNGGDVWTRWNEFLKSALINHQRKDGDEAGSWIPVGDFSVEWGRAGQTALAALCLEVYYRYPRVSDD